MRYEKFLIDNYKTIRPAIENEGLQVISHNISEVEQCENRNQCKTLEAVFYTLSELFEVHNLEMQTTFEANSFFLIKGDDGEIKHGVNSLWLSREKLKSASALELSGAIIDLILYRDKWRESVSYKAIYLTGEEEKEGGV